MICVDSYRVIQSESSSKGNQIKFYSNGYWVKLDNDRCYEGLAEHFTSMFESCIEDFSYVPYYNDTIVYKDEEYLGCYSYNMYNNLNISFISLRRLFRQNNIPLNIFIKNESIEVNIQNVIKETYKLTGVNISNYLFRLLLLDALIINEDRHYMNLGVVTDRVKYYEAQCFDNGSSLFCTNWTYRKRKSFEENIQSAKSVARPFSKFFDKQVKACINLGAKPLVINKNKLDYFLSNYSNPLYSGEKIELIKSVLKNRLGYYYNQGVYILV
jgi:hypothetical protein